MFDSKSKHITYFMNLLNFTFLIHRDNTMVTMVGMFQNKSPQSWKIGEIICRAKTQFR